MAKGLLEKELLESLQEACELITRSYREQTGKRVRFEVIQFSDIAKPQSKRDIVRELAQLYDEYEGNENYIHIPDMAQMAHNLKDYPIISVINEENDEIEGATTIKYHHNIEGDIDPYYPKLGVKSYSITGILVRQRENITNKGLGTSMYEAAILGLQKYAMTHQEENVEINCVIDFTNLRSMYAFANANNNIDARELVGEDNELMATLEGVYVVQDFETKELVEAPTAVLKVDVAPKRKNKFSRKQTDKPKHEFVFSIDRKEKVYFDILKEIMQKIRPTSGPVQRTTMIDEDAGIVTYIPVQSGQIQVEDMVIYPNGTEKIGKNRIPRKDVATFVGPTENIWIKRDSKEGDER